MGTRSVRLDQEAEDALDALVERTGASLSTILKRGILTLRDQEIGERQRAPSEIYAELDLGPGGYAIAPARRSRDAVRDAIAKRHRR